LNRIFFFAETKTKRKKLVNKLRTIFFSLRNLNGLNKDFNARDDFKKIIFGTTIYAELQERKFFIRTKKS
jgi:hypothetical protein